ncbi:MAG: IMPACT family protein [Muribaculaceae bacterium]|nr:IMPACT family protein [Muribaculaceae bacterium]
MADLYKTISEPSTATIREKMSRFIAFAHPVETAEQAKGVIADYQRKYHDARHVCWAYMLGQQRLDFLSSDNGEPSGTAGKPILGQINSFGLTNIVIVVVRYFGGIKLGTPGLIQAYREAARSAIEEATIVEERVKVTSTVSFGYVNITPVMRILKNPSVNILSQNFDNTCSITFSTAADDMEPVLAQLKKVEGLSVVG